MTIQILTSRSTQITFLVFLLLGALGFLVTSPPLVENLRQRSFDTYNRLLPRPSGGDVVIVGIDEASVKHLGQWPWGRDVIGDLTTKLHDMGARSVAFDVVFPERDRTAAQAEAKGDIAANDVYFAEKMKQAGNVVIGFVSSDPSKQGKERVTTSDIVYKGASAADLNPYFFKSPYFMKSLPSLRAAAAGNGYTNFIPESDSVLRRVPLMMRHVDDQGKIIGVYPALSMEAVRVALGAQTHYEVMGSAGEGIKEIHIGSFIIPTDGNGVARVYYAGHESKMIIPAWQILAGKIDKALVKDKIILVGVSSGSLGDVRTSPLDAYMQGVEMHAEMIEQIMQGQFLRRPSVVVFGEAAVTLAVCLLLIILAQELNALLLTALAGCIIFALSLGGIFAHSRWGWLLDPLCPSIIIAVIFVFASILASLRAKILFREKSRFLALMSHEIRTPMTGILGMVECMKDDALTRDEQREFIDTISECSKTLLNTLNDILDVSKLEEGKLEISNVNFDLHATLRNSTSLLERMAQNKGIYLRVSIDADVPREVHGDPHRLRQVVMNLINNAIKFTAKGGVVVRCALKKEVRCAFKKNADMPMIRVEVRDTGIGISEKNLKKLFKNFSQADDSIARSYGGTGLGLSIARDLMNLMGGHVGVESKVGEGSTFWFELPCKAPVPVVEAKEENTIMPPMKILLAEDNKINQQIAVRLLNKKGHKVTIADDGETVVRMAREHDFDMILMDMNMPVKSGIDATREIRAFGGKYKTLPIIALTANVVDEYIKKCYAAGMNAHVAKPFSVHELYQIMARFAPVQRILQEEVQIQSVEKKSITEESTEENLNENMKEIRRQLGPVYLKELIQNSLKEAGRLLKLGREFYEAGDNKNMERAMHDLKNVSGLIGMDETSHCAAVIETLCRKNELTALPDMMKILLREGAREMRTLEKTRR